MTTVFFTYTHHNDNDEYRRFGGEKLEKSLKHFYPNIPFVHFENVLLECENPIHNNKLSAHTIEPVLGIKLAEQYDHIIKFDLDSIVVDTLDDLFTNDYDLASVRNQNDKSHAGIYGPCIIDGIDIFKYMNGGLISVRNKQFWKDWYDYNQENNVNTWGMGAQDSLNILAWKSDKYKVKLLDPLGSDLYYGTSNLWGEGGLEIWDNQSGSHWDSWKQIIRKSDGLYLESPRTHRLCKVKALHHAGGTASHEKLTECYFNKETWEYIQEIIK